MNKLVMEGYVGKTPNLVKVEKIFEEIKTEIASVGDDKIAQYKYAMQLNLTWDKRFRLVEKLFEKEFGFKKFQLISKSNVVANAFTMISSKFTKVNISKMPELPTKHGKRYYDASQQYLCSVWLYSSLFVDLTPGEIMAIILHEVGHNFDVVRESWVADCIAHFMLQNRADFEKDQAEEYEDGLNYYKWERRRDSETENNNMSKVSIERLREFLNSVKIPRFDDLLNLVVYPIAGPILSVLVAMSGGYWRSVASEFFADSFATAYGYGPDLISSFKKFEDENIYLGKADSFLGTVNYTTRILPGILFFMLDVHPSTQARLKRQITDLEKIVNDPDTPKETKQLAKRDADLCKAIYKEYLNGGGSWTRQFYRVVQDTLFASGSFDFRGYLIKLNALSTEEEAKRMVKKGK